MRGDLYRLDPTALTTEPLTATGTVSNPVLSPEGTRIAYRQASQLGLDALDRVQAEGEMELPSVSLCCRRRRSNGRCGSFKHTRKPRLSGLGAFALDGRMVDMPVVRAAENTMRRAWAAGVR